MLSNASGPIRMLSNVSGSKRMLSNSSNCFFLLYWLDPLLQTLMCTPEYKKLPGHTMCMKDKPNVSKQGMTEAEKLAVLDQHNRLRGGVNPPATDLVKLVSRNASWSFVHDPCINGTLYRAVMSYTGFNFKFCLVVEKLTFHVLFIYNVLNEISNRWKIKQCDHTWKQYPEDDEYQSAFLFFRHLVF